MPLNFPENPTLNQYYVYNGIRWRWNGYGWTSAGISGGNTVVGGICGEYVAALTGGVGITLTNPAGIVEISLRLDEPNIGPINTPVSHTAPSSFSADTGIARKVAFLEADGSITFDFIKNYDVFRNAEFNFDILSFNIPGLSPQLAGNPAFNFSFQPYVAQITYNQTPVATELDILTNTGGELTSAYKTGFPTPVNGFAYAEHNFQNTETVRYKNLIYNNIGSNQDFYIVKLGVTGENSDGTQTYKIKNYNLYFGNYLFYGAVQSSSINQTNFQNLQSNIILSRNYVLNSFTIPQDNNNPYYLYFAYPARLGLATFKDNTTNLEGGFVAQQQYVEYTNSRSYTENYIIYRSENSNLGTVSITVS